MKVDRGRLFVAGGGTGGAWVYDASTGATIAAYSFAAAPTSSTTWSVTKEAAWSTDSQRAALYRVHHGPTAIPRAFQPSRSWRLRPCNPASTTNGIEATLEREAARDRPVQHRGAVHRDTSIGVTPDRSRGRRERPSATGSCWTKDAVTSCRTG